VSVSRHILVIGLLAAVTPALAAPGGVTTAGAPTTVTRHEPPAKSGDWTPRRMKQAKPMPLPSIGGPPAPPRPTAKPFAEPPGASSPGSGAPEPR
jgi:hypothetical protein